LQLRGPPGPHPFPPRPPFRSSLGTYPPTCYLADRAGIRGLFSDADPYHLDQAFPLLMKQLELMLTSGELNPRHQHTVTLYAKGLTCKADTLSSCDYVYLAVYPTPEMKN
ncbi:type IV toxin-antitoxin system YeeU family antitoxin, partial [Ligilactobacillus salivarius]|nr:type IV toxin-antitoxin system YeeU family antitoxin [Ligilactobacillus salivarius]